MKKATFLIFGCPHTALVIMGTVDAFVVAEPDKNLYHFRRNTNRILNLIGFSGVKDIRLVGCSQEFTAELTEMIASRPECGFRVTSVEKSDVSVRRDIVGVESANDVIVVEREPNLIPIAFQLAQDGSARIVVVDPMW